MGRICKYILDYVLPSLASLNTSHGTKKETPTTHEKAKVKGARSTKISQNSVRGNVCFPIETCQPRRQDSSTRTAFHCPKPGQPANRTSRDHISAAESAQTLWLIRGKSIHRG
ncbi:hypothetical protein RvY_14475-1 [Ramazzottius varieornatus]|uniref:Uncharacterized protein n=1 Tax=Ramazzottius varieornatus TaxID=947166 RepID=A0A1D1VYS9_RAMVA|nr:hypothetical protein RvY_14475-1 [Ramazzottius varieornatus]